MAMRIGAVLSTLLVMVTWVVSPAWPAELVPHRAIYRITLGSSTPGSGVVGTEGAMLYRFDDGCDGWTVENKTYVRYHRDQAESIETSWTYVTWESKDGLAYRFRVKNDRNGETFQRFQGTASLGGSGGAGLARYSKPRDTEIPLPAGALFPTKHLVQLLAAARDGIERFTRVVFDGSSIDNPMEISAVITPLQATDRKAAAAATGLRETPVWSVRLAFFGFADRDALPEFEVDIRYREDGIADRLRQDFGDFILDLKLTEIQVLPRPAC